MSQGSPIGLWSRWQRRRRIAHDTQLLLKEARRIMRKHGHRLKESIASEINQAMVDLAEMRREKDYEGAGKRLEKLDRLLDKHLGFARKSTIREYAESIGVAVLIALLLRTFVVEAFKIPSGSMLPTLEVGDHIFVNKFAYGLRIPLTHVKFFRRTPRRGDVIVFIYPKDTSKDFIKRVVAVGGDTVEVHDGIVIVNGQPVEHHKINTVCTYPDQEEGSEHWDIRRCTAYLEHVKDGYYRVIQDVGPYARRVDSEPQRIPEGHVFVMGDNRDNSHDSRFWGTVDENMIKGKAMVIWWSSGTPDGIRWGRFFTLIHASTKDAVEGPLQVKAP